VLHIGGAMQKAYWLVAAAFLCTSDVAAFAEDLLHVDKSKDGIYKLTATGVLDNLNVYSMEINRGNCVDTDPRRFPFVLKFGQELTLGYYTCNPIEVKLVSNLGTETFTWFENNDANVKIDLFPYGPVLYEFHIIGLNNSVRVENVITNRGNCKLAVGENNGLKTLKFGEDYIYGYYNSLDCKPIEIQVTTNIGSETFGFTW
jgi:hypothetical protein